MAQLTVRNIYDDDVYREVLGRIDTLTRESQPQWGRMSVGQMLAHCAEIQEVFNGKELGHTPVVGRLFKGFIRRMVVSDRPYPKNTRTHPQYIQTDPRDFETQKERLLAAIDRFRATEDHPVPHPLFGDLTRHERGWAMYKHLDHHLRQFGV